MKALTEGDTGKGFFIRQMTQAQSITEALKAADPMEWVRKMSNI